MLDIIMEIFGFILKLLTGYTAVMSIFFLLFRKRHPRTAPKTRFALLLPARNEENVIGALIKNLQQQDYPKELYDIYVIPNNCTDSTEAVALQAGAKILHCTAPVSTKGEVLHQIFDSLLGTYDAYCVFDADNLLDKRYLSRMNDAISAGARVAKSRQCALNPYDSWVSGAYDIYFQSINLLYSQAREAFGLSAKLVGTGFMVTDSLLQQMGGWNTVTLTEDIEFAAQCAMIGERVWYVHDAVNYDEEPLSFRVSLRQRQRWSAGVQSVARIYAGRLFSLRPTWLRWDLAIHIIMIPVQLLTLIPLVYSLIWLPLPQLLLSLGISLASFVAGGWVLALFLSLTAGRSFRRQWKAILCYPLFLGSWYPMHFWALIAKPKTWKPIVHGVATQRRNAQEEENEEAALH